MAQDETHIENDGTPEVEVDPTADTAEVDAAAAAEGDTAEVDVAAAAEADAAEDTLLHPTVVLSEEEGVGAPNPDPEPEKLPWWKSTRNRIVGIVLALVAAVAIAVGVALLLPIELTNRQVLDEFDATVLESDELTDSIYASNVGYKLTDCDVDSIDDRGEGSKTAHITAVLENDSFAVDVEVSRDYQLVGRTWVPKTSTVESRSAKPVAPADGARVIADMDTLLSKVPPKDGVSLSTLLEGGNYEVMDAALAEDASSCTVTIQADKLSGLYRYAGPITAEFSFVEGAVSMEAGSWKLGRVSADDSCWTRSTAPLTGEWKGTREATSTSALLFDTGTCDAGKSRPARLNVRSFDVDTGRMEVDATFVAHGHRALPGSVATAEGDTEVSESLVVVLDRERLTGKVSGKTGGASWTLSFLNADGIWKLQVESNDSADDGALLGATTFTDVYMLERA